MLMEGESDAVSVVFYEEGFPEFYQPFESGPSEAFALALHLQNPAAAQDCALFELDMQQSDFDAQCPDWVSALDLLPLLCGEQQEVRLREPRVSWKLERHV